VEAGERGWCRTRENRDGTLYALSYGAVSSVSANPIEKKPFYHFHPGTTALTVGSWSCNAACPWCQNHEISRSAPSGGRFIAPGELVDLARARGCEGTSISFNEPTLSLEWSLELFPAAHEAGLYNTFVTNGTMTEPALERLIEADLDAMSVDLKGRADAVRRYCGHDVETVWRNCRRARAAGLWLEMVTLVIPGVNDDPEGLGHMATRIVDELGAGTPWHLNRYHPAYRFTAPATPPGTLHRAREIALEAGLHYVYLGNLHDGDVGHTDCPGCGARLLTRGPLRLETCTVTCEGECPECAYPIEGVGWERATA
jgi:pyruvate formate lyase activating enzyme